MARMFRTGLLALIAILAALPARAAEMTVAVAANFLTTAETLAQAYEYETGETVRIAHGSTGRLYAQIVAGAPFDLFLAADDTRPARLLDKGRALQVATYALGRLVLVSRGDPGDPAEALKGRRVAIADPAVAPYGAMAIEAMASFGVDPGEVRLIYGDSVGQAAGLFATGNADAAILARAQLPGLGEDLAVIPLDGRHAPIRQDVALISEDPAARDFFRWLASPVARQVIARAGYGLSE